MRGIATLLLTVFACNACFSYAPAPAAGPPPEQGTAVRVYLSEPQDVRLTEITGNDVVRIDGEIAAADADEMVLSAWWLHARSGYEFRGQGETVRVARENVARVERKRLSYLRSGGLVALGVLAGILFTVVEVGGGGRGPGEDPGTR